MKNLENVSKTLYDLLISKDFAVTILDIEGKSVNSADEARIFNFDYTSNGNDYGSVVVLLSPENSVDIFCSNAFGKDMRSDDKSDWYDFLYQIRMFAKRHLFNFSVKDIAKLKYTIKDIASAAKEDPLSEGWTGTKRRSETNGPGNTTKLIILHDRPIDETVDKRYRNIDKLFIENANGERFAVPSKRLAAGRMLARHVAEGGTPYDQRGQHIISIADDLAKLGKFARTSKRRTMPADTQTLVELAVEHYHKLRKEAKALLTRRGYHNYFSNWSADERVGGNIEQLKELFTSNSLEQCVEDCLPIIAKLSEQGTNMSYADQYSNWANQLTEGTWSVPDTPEKIERLKALLSNELIVGVDAQNATGELYDLVGDDNLFDLLGDIADEDPDTDVSATVKNWLKNNAPQIYAKIGFDLEDDYDTNTGDNGDDFDQLADYDANAESDEDTPDEYNSEESDNEGDARHDFGESQELTETWGDKQNYAIVQKTEDYITLDKFEYETAYDAYKELSFWDPRDRKAHVVVSRDGNSVDAQGNSKFGYTYRVEGDGKEVPFDGGPGEWPKPKLHHRQDPEWEPESYGDYKHDAAMDEGLEESIGNSMPDSLVLVSLMRETIRTNKETGGKADMSRIWNWLAKLRQNHDDEYAMTVYKTAQALVNRKNPELATEDSPEVVSMKGDAARRDNVSADANPYHPNSKEHRQWATAHRGELDEAKTKSPAALVRAAYENGDLIGVDQISRSTDGTNTFVFRRGFFYSHGGTSEKFAAKVDAMLTTAGIDHTMLENGEKWAPFRGGAGVKASTHWWAKVQINGSTQPEHGEVVQEYDAGEDFGRNAAYDHPEYMAWKKHAYKKGASHVRPAGPGELHAKDPRGNVISKFNAADGFAMNESQLNEMSTTLEATVVGGIKFELDMWPDKTRSITSAQLDGMITGAAERVSALWQKIKAIPKSTPAQKIQAAWESLNEKWNAMRTTEAVDPDSAEAVNNKFRRMRTAEATGDTKHALGRVEELEAAINSIQKEREEWVRRGYDTAELDMDLDNLQDQMEELLGEIQSMSDEEDNPFDVSSDAATPRGNRPHNQVNESEHLADIKVLSGLK